MSNPTAEQRLFTEEEHEYWVKERTRELRNALADSNAALRETRLRVSIAEWAIAGILSRNLHVSCTYDDAQAKDREMMAKYIGKNAGTQLLHAAELNFQKHAEYAQLQARMQEKPYIHHSTDDKFDVEQGLWPKP